jgi:predicted nuclease with TOPRIM domain
LIQIPHDIAILILEIVKDALKIALAITPVAVGAMTWRGHQDRRQTNRLGQRLAKEVGEIRTQAGEVRKQVTEVKAQVGKIDGQVKAIQALEPQLKELKAAQVITQDLVAIHSDRLKEGNAVMGSLTRDIDELKELFPALKDIVTKFVNHFERKQASTLTEKPLPGGMTAIKQRKDPNEES